MRRLQTQSRGGTVKSQRDYQIIIDLGKPLSFTPEHAGMASITIRYEGEEEAETLAGFGGYFIVDPNV